MDFANRGPLGLRKPKLTPEEKAAIGKARRKAVRKVSKKRAAYLKSPERQGGLAHMARVASLPCMVCGYWPVEVHHLTLPHDDMMVAPLCAQHHRREFGPGSFHYSPKAFWAENGDLKTVLAKVADMLAGQFNW
jgi:hypothetical protein